MGNTPKRAAAGGKRDGRAPGRDGHDLLVVGLGASAGGIGALERFFGLMPPDSGMAFVVVLHLSPEHESNLPELLQRHTAMPVTQVGASVGVEPNHVYVIPPAKHMVMEDGHIHLAEPPKEPGRRVPIDLLFRTLGAAYREHAVGVILSGTGSDGTLGLRRIKEEGGISMAQEPQEAEYDGMPRSAIRDGMVDFVLPVAEMPAKLVGIGDVSRRIKLPPEGSEPPQGEELVALRDILALLRVRTGHDFSGYKQSTLLRRITRRMQMHEMPTLAAYRQYLREYAAELSELMRDLLISVTNFFRDPAAFDFLGREVVPKLFEGKREDDHVRVWVTGCATGEEAYSLAILLAEHAARLERPPRLQVFATDLDEASVAQAREGVFPEAIAADVSPERLQQFFTHEGRHYSVRKHVREMILFAPHNILRDPPFSRIDMVSCRNLLIYLNRETQERVLEVFHFALRPGGFLFLGTAESGDSPPGLFTPVDKKLRVFRRNSLASALYTVPPMTPSLGRWQPRPPNEAASPALRSYRYAELHLALLEHHAPPSVLVNEAYDVVHVSEKAGKYLRLAGGEPSNSLLALVHPDLRLDVRAALYTAAQGAGEAATRALPIRLDGETCHVTVRVSQTTHPDLHATYLLVIFDEEAGEPPAPETAPAGTEGEEARVVARLEAELQHTRSLLRATVEQYEAANEELRASNEELQALNEELRSASEELETGKEELHSLNEELHTVNAELKDKVEELGRANADLSNLLVATDIGTVFLDSELNITRFTPLFAELFNVIPADVGRPFAHLTHRLDYDGLPQDASLVLRRLHPVEREVRSADGPWYAARLLPYRTLDDHIAGVVITFMDITTRKLAEERAQHVHDQLVLATDAAEAGRGTWDLRTGAAEWDERGKRIIGFAGDAEAATYAGWLARVHPEDRPAVEAHMAECAARGKDFDMEYRVVRADGQTRFVGAKGRFQKAEAGAPVGGTGLVVDVTERRDAVEQLRESEGWLRALFESATDYAIFTMGADLRITSWSAGAERLFGYTEEEALGRPGDIIFTPEDRERGAPDEEQQRADTDGRAADERWHLRKDGSRFYMSGVLSPLRGGNGPSPGYVKIGRDLTQQHRDEQERAELAAQLEAERGSLEQRVEERTRLLMTEVAERRTAEERVRELVSRIVETQELERRRISRDLHDILGQQLTALRLNLEAIKESCGEKDASMSALIEQAQASAGRLDSEVDFLAWELRPVALDEVGLASALENFVHEWSAHFGVAAEYHSAGLGKRRLAPELETNLYRIAQEALNNIAKHGAARRVGVILERREQHVALIVEDDGRGFDPSEPTGDEAGMGLFNMRERAALVGGTLEIESAPGEGTTVFARVPARFAERR